jgi:regulator of cell morphogenesis and NO signaling
MTLAILTASLADQSLGDLVHADGRRAIVFEQFGLDFCCGGKRSLADAAREQSVPVADIVLALAALGEASPLDQEPPEWRDLDVLVRHILEIHHGYVRSSTPSISAWLDRLVERHGGRHPELAEARRIFAALSEDLAAHMMKEEHMLFPAITELAAAKRRGGSPPLSPFGTVANPIRMMEDEHEGAGDLIGQLRTLTAQFTPPDDGCTTYRACYAELARYERDLHRHVHLENNVLFPRAIELERTLG